MSFFSIFGSTKRLCRFLKSDFICHSILTHCAFLQKKKSASRYLQLPNQTSELCQPSIFHNEWAICFYLFSCHSTWERGNANNYGQWNSLCEYSVSHHESLYMFSHDNHIKTVLKEITFLHTHYSTNKYLINAIFPAQLPQKNNWKEF